MLDDLTDGHVADKAAYGDAAAFGALFDRFGETVWRVAALASGDEATATRATARAFTRTLAAVATNMTDPGVPIGRALVATGHELAAAARTEGADLDLPPAVAEAEPDSRVAAWLEVHEGWTAADAGRATATGPLFTARPEVPTALRVACRDLTLAVPPAAGDAATAAWVEWQGVGLTIPEHHPLTTVLSRLDAPLGRLGSAMSRAGSGVAAAARSRRHRPARVTAPAHRPVADHLPIDADDVPTDEPAVRDARAAMSVAAPVAAATTMASPAAPSDEAEEGGVDLELPTTEPVLADDDLFGPRTDDIDLPDRRRGPLDLVTAGGSPTRSRVIAALAAGILTASALGSLLTTAPEATDGGRSDQVAAGQPDPARGEGDLLDDPVLIEPAVATRDADDGADDPGAAVVAGATADNPDAPRAARDGDAPQSGGPSASPSGGGDGPTSGTPTGGGGGGGAAPGPDPTPAPPAAPAPTAPAPTTAPPAPAPTTPAPTTAPPAPPTTAPAPTTTAPGAVCTLLPVLCPGGGLIP